MKNELTFREIWNTLRKTDCSKHVKSIPGPGGRKFSYLSWTWAWGILMQEYPDAIVSFDTFKQSDGTEVDAMYYPDGTASVQTTITIGGCTRTIRNAVMDNRYNALKNPNARDINDARMRTMTKTLAFFGLGTECYFGDDLPEPVEEKREDRKPKKATAIKRVDIVPSPNTNDLPPDPFKGNNSHFFKNIRDGVAQRNTLVELSGFYKEALLRMKAIAEEGSPIHKEVLSIFTERKNELKENSDGK